MSLSEQQPYALMSGVVDKEARPKDANRFPVPLGWDEVAEAYQTASSKKNKSVPFF